MSSDDTEKHDTYTGNRLPENTGIVSKKKKILACRDKKIK